MSNEDDDYEVDDDYGYDEDDEESEMEECNVKTVDEIIDFFGKLYTNRSRITSVLACYSENTKDKKASRCGALGMVCSAEIHKYGNLLVNPDVLYLSLWKYPSLKQEVADAYWNFLFSSNWSPWRGIAKHVTIIRDSDGIMRAWRLDNLDVPKDLLFNLIIATRAPLENHPSCELFHALVEAKLPRYAAMYWSAFLSVKNGYIFTRQDNAHYQFDPLSSVNVDLEKLKNATPTLAGVNYLNSSKTLPLNYIWYKNEKQEIKRYNNRGERIQTAYAPLFKELAKQGVADKRMFSKAATSMEEYNYGGKGLCSIESFITNLKAMPDVWKLPMKKAEAT